MIADDHAVVIEGIRHILEPAFDVVGSVEDGRALVAAAKRLKPDVVVVDVSMPLLNGIDAVRQIRKTNPRVKTLFLTMHADVSYATEAFDAGASGYVLKQSVAAELVTAIREVLDGREYLSPQLSPGPVRPHVTGTPSSPLLPGALTPRQREVLQLVAEGRSVKEIARLLRVSPKTVEFHKHRISEGLGLRTAELTKYAVAHHLTSL